jgi:hypothetical protein
MREKNSNPFRKKLVKTTTFSVTLLIALTLILVSGIPAIATSGESTQMNTNERSISGSVKDFTPNPKTALNMQPTTRAIWDIQLDFDVEAASGALGNAGAEWDGNYLYSTRWASNLIHQYDSTGALVKEFSISGVSGLRDLAYDGTYFYGGAAGGTIYEMDFSSETLISSITGGFQSRAIAYDEDLDLFYCSNWGDPVWKVDRTGAIVGTIDLVSTTSTYGLAYDAQTTDSPYLWVFDQTSGGAVIHQWDLTAGAYTTVTHDVNGDFTNAGIAGGLFFCDDFVSGYATVGGLSQGTPDIMVCYEIEQLTAPDHDIGIKAILDPSTGLAGGNLPVTVKVQNFGNNTETSIDVHVTIDKITPPTTVWSYGFEDWTIEGFTHPGWTNELVVGTDPDCYWQGHDEFHYIYPDADPYEGTVCALVDTGYVTNYGQTRAWYNTPFDFQSMGGAVYTLYGMFHKRSYGGTSQAGQIDVQLSTDGSTWTTVGSIDMYDAADPGWVQDTADLTSFKDEPVVYLGFLGIDGGYSDILMDDISIGVASIINEYDETEYITSLAPGAQVDVNFPTWTPSDWQIAENIDIDYYIEAESTYSDDNPGNNYKDKQITLTYLFLHDIAVISVDSPAADGDAQTLPVQCTIKNVGSFPECCYQTSMEIGEVLGSFIDEDFSGGVPPSGWGTTHPSNWGSSATSNAGGVSPEARFSWTPSATAEFRLYTGPMDTTGFTNMDLEFKEYVNDYNGAYTLKVETSTDGINWMTAYSRAGGPYGPTTTTVPLDTSLGMGSSTLQVSFTFSGYSYNINYWYIDDVSMQAPSVITEYYDTVCTIELDPGEEAQLTFDDWTPDALALGMSGFKNYMAIGTQMLATDTNPANDMALAAFTLEYRHDVGIQAITEPSMGRNPDTFYAFNSYPGDESVWFESTNPGVLNTIGPNTAPDFIPAGTWADGVWYVSVYGTGALYTVDPNDGTMTLIGGGVSGGWNGIAYDGSTMYGATSTQLYTIDLGTGTSTLVGSLGNAGLMIDIAIDQDTGICYGHDIVDDNIYTIDLGTGAATVLGPTGLACNYAQGMEFDQGNDVLYLAAYTTQGELYTCDVGTGACTLVGAFDGGAEVTALAIPYTTGPGPIPIDIWVAPGTYPLEAIVENLGTFEETGLTCYADLIEFVTDPNGTLVFSDQVDNIDLDPLGDEATVTFTSYDFQLEGAWGLFMDFPLANDDVQGNNDDQLGIGVDDTAPTSWHTLNPANPDGSNGWYVSDVTVSLDSDDDTATYGWQSGVAELKYQINGGTVQTIPGTSGSFVISDDGDDIEVKYWAVDKVGNAEAPNQFTIDIDQTKPTIVLTHEVIGGNQIQGWDITFTATCSDAMSGLDIVKFYLNDVWQFEDETAPYEWTITGWTGGGFVDVTFKATVWDLAGLDASDSITNPENLNVNSQQNVLQQNLITQKLNLA